MTADEAGSNLTEMLTDLYLEGKISAKSICILCFWAHRAGVKAAASLSFKPNAVTGHYQRHLDTVLKTNAMDLYEIPAACHCKFDVVRTNKNFEALVPHEGLKHEVDTIGLRVFQDNMQDTGLSELYRDHPLFQECLLNNDPLPIPLALYVDGVPFTNSDSFIGFWIEVLPTKTRHIVCLLRKSDLCKCGCRGYDTIFAVWMFIRWSLVHMVSGKSPVARHDGKDWKSSDRNRAGNAGGELGYRAVVVQVKADWAELASTFGFVPWSVLSHPCLLCTCTAENRFDLRGISLVDFGEWTEADQNLYEQACRTCEVRVLIPSRAMHARIRALLVYDRRKKGSHGRALQVDIVDLGLLRGDRLEPTTDLPDVAMFDDITDFPVQVLFWRVSAETRVRRRFPVFGDDTMVTLACLAVDTLHTIHLGVVLVFVSYALWHLISENVYGFQGSTEDRLQQSVSLMRARLFVFYDEWDLQHPGKSVCRLTNLTTQMLGDKDKPRLHAKAAEAAGILPFCVAELAQRAADTEKGRLLQAAGAAVCEFLELLRAEPVKLSVTVAQKLLDLAVRHVTLAARADIALKPKHHLFIHLAQRSLEMGNPRAYATFHSESVNGQMALIAASNHRQTWARKSYFKFALRYGGPLSSASPKDARVHTNSNMRNTSLAFERCSLANRGQD